jgi:hypothetical protein
MKVIVAAELLKQTGAHVCILVIREEQQIVEWRYINCLLRNFAPWIVILIEMGY